MLNKIYPVLAGIGRQVQINEATISGQGDTIVNILIVAGFSIITASGLVRILQAVIRHDNRGAGKEAIDHLFAYLVVFLFMIGMHAIKRYFG
jgi:vacuolar-type H+-ATPase subunit I/STV1